MGLQRIYIWVKLLYRYLQSFKIYFYLFLEGNLCNLFWSYSPLTSPSSSFLPHRPSLAQLPVLFGLFFFFILNNLVSLCHPSSLGRLRAFLMPIDFPEEYFPVQVINSPIGMVLDEVETEVFVLYQNFPVRQKFGNILAVPKVMLLPRARDRKETGLR